ncbi:hypothetical protein, partial [Pseudomonas sp. SWRI51]|uniref:hypothetical protein n=1 Tax=Pseudomonas sp. SWRI51 TaxID=2745491 RepID=UPI001EE30E99
PCESRSSSRFISQNPYLRMQVGVLSLRLKKFRHYAPRTELPQLRLEGATIIPVGERDFPVATLRQDLGSGQPLPLDNAMPAHRAAHLWTFPVQYN